MPTNFPFEQGIGRALRHVLRFCCLFSLEGNVQDIHVGEVESLHEAFQDEMALLFPVGCSSSLLTSSSIDDPFTNIVVLAH